MTTAVVTGGSSGLGRCIAQELDRRSFNVYDWSLNKDVDVRSPESIASAAERIKQSRIDFLINCAGVNQLKWFPALQVEEWDRIMNTNARSILLTTRALLDRMYGGTVVNIVSNASHVPMTCSLVYNASKAAALMMTKQMARELKKTHNLTVFSVSPNKLFGTGMSEQIDREVCETRGWTPEQARSYQLAALPAGTETDPEDVAKFLADILTSNHDSLNGCDLPYGA